MPPGRKNGFDKQCDVTQKQVYRTFQKCVLATKVATPSIFQETSRTGPNCLEGETAKLWVSLTFSNAEWKFKNRKLLNFVKKIAGIRRKWSCQSCIPVSKQVEDEIQIYNTIYNIKANLTKDNDQVQTKTINKL